MTRWFDPLFFPSNSFIKIQPHCSTAAVGGKCDRQIYWTHFTSNLQQQNRKERVVQIKLQFIKELKTIYSKTG